METSKKQVLTDKVQASAREFPYNETHVKIQGYEYISDPKKRKQKADKEMLLRIRMQQAEEKEIEITKYINSIGSSKIRRMIEYKYIEAKDEKKPEDKAGKKPEKTRRNQRSDNRWAIGRIGRLR